MSERGKARYSFLALGSNTTIKSGAGSLYAVVTSNPAGSSVRVEDTTSLGQAADLNTGGANTIALLSGGNSFLFGEGVGFNVGLTVSATSNARVSVAYE